LAGDDAFVVCFEQDAHGVHDGVGVLERVFVGFGVEDVGAFPGDVL
jgi:hypothetical protein